MTKPFSLYESPTMINKLIIYEERVGADEDAPRLSNPSRHPCFSWIEDNSKNLHLQDDDQVEVEGKKNGGDD